MQDPTSNEVELCVHADNSEVLESSCPSPFPSDSLSIIVFLYSLCRRKENGENSLKEDVLYQGPLVCYSWIRGFLSLLLSFFFFISKKNVALWRYKENMQALWIKDIRPVNIICVISYSQVRNVINVYIIFLGIFSVLIFKIMIM